MDAIPLSVDELDHRTFPEAVVSGAAVPALALNSAPQENYTTAYSAY